MNVSSLNERITLQKNSVTVDGIGNHKNEWEDYFSCFAYASTYSTDETEGEVTEEERSITFSVRCCPELFGISSTGYRVVFRDEVWNILSVDLMNYQRREVKIHCQSPVLHIEVYTDYKDPATELIVEKTLTEHGLFYSKSETWIPSEKLYEVLYEVNV